MQPATSSTDDGISPEGIGPDGIAVGACDGDNLEDSKRRVLEKLDTIEFTESKQPFVDCRTFTNERVGSPTNVDTNRNTNTDKDNPQMTVTNTQITSTQSNNTQTSGKSAGKTSGNGDGSGNGGSPINATSKSPTNAVSPTNKGPTPDDDFLPLEKHADSSSELLQAKRSSLKTGQNYRASPDRQDVHGTPITSKSANQGAIPNNLGTHSVSFVDKVHTDKPIAEIHPVEAFKNPPQKTFCGLLIWCCVPKRRIKRQDDDEQEGNEPIEKI